CDFTDKIQPRVLPSPFLQSRVALFFSLCYEWYDLQDRRLVCDQVKWSNLHNLCVPSSRSNDFPSSSIEIGMLYCGVDISLTLNLGIDMC
ncbi:hypothetical protein EJD97_020527, partial [Solanum chilense]